MILKSYLTDSCKKNQDIFAKKMLNRIFKLVKFRIYVELRKIFFIKNRIGSIFFLFGFCCGLQTTRFAKMG